MMRRLAIIALAAAQASIGLAACGGTRPPERLVSVTAELDEVGAQDLAEAQPNLVREARDQRDAAWQAYESGDDELAEVHAWTGWLRLRTAENLETIAHSDAMRLAGGAQPSEATAVSDGSADPVATPSGVARPGGAAGAPGAPATVDERTAIDAVRDAEDARLRLLSAGLTPDLRWAEAEALLQTAQRALERGELARAEELGSRAAFVFEVVRLTRVGDSTPQVSPLASVSGGQAPPASPTPQPTTTAPAPVSAQPVAATPQPTAAPPQPATPAAPAPSFAIPSPTPTVVVVPGGGDAAAPAPTPAPTPTPAAGEGDADDAPRSRVISDILQPVE